MRITVFGATVLAWVLTGCSAKPVVAPVVVSAPEGRVENTAVIHPAERVNALAVRVEPVGPAERQRILRVLELLDKADLAIKEKRLTEPRGHSAVDYYRQVLFLQPGFEEAERGLATLVERYVEWSDAAALQGRLDRARGYLAKARRVDPADPAIVEAAARLRNLGRRDGGYTRIDARELGIQSPDLVVVLGRLADRIYAENARVVIEAPTDAQGRWIYRQLNSRHQEFRVRANLRLDPQPGIRLLY